MGDGERCDARLILICGLPGAGKSTLAKRLAEQLPALRLSPDEWKAYLGIDPFDEPARVLLEQQLWRHTRRLLELGQTVILEHGFWDAKNATRCGSGRKASGSRSSCTICRSRSTSCAGG